MGGALPPVLAAGQLGQQTKCVSCTAAHLLMVACCAAPCMHHVLYPLAAVRPE
jgi:hypothetical protein